jgi:murein DD-endopeptidase MepM/ murein hydrolase activator NlpD
VKRGRVLLGLFVATTLAGGAAAGTDPASAPGAAATAAPVSPGQAAAPAPLPIPQAAAPRTAGMPNELDRLLARYDAEERALRDEQSRLGPDLELTKRRMLARGRAYYKQVHAGLLPAGGGFDALVDHAAHVEQNRRALARDAARIEYLTRRGGEISERLVRLRAERAPLEVQREAMDRARNALQQADERRAAFARAFDSSQRPPDYLAVYGAEQGPNDADPRKGFKSLKGRLSFPLAGRAEVRRVTVPGAGTPALELTTPPGAIVRAVGPGRIAFADKHDDYGLVVIVDHGDRYFSIYANLGAVDAHLGDVVAGGARLGALGTGDAHATLHFELRHGADAIEPSGWLGL